MDYEKTLQNTDPVSLSNFKEANPGLKFDAEENAAYQKAGQVGGAITKDGIISQDGVNPINAPITSSTLANVTPVVVPQVNTASSATGLSGAATGAAQSTLTKATDEAAKAAQQAKDSSKSDYKSIVDEIAGIQSNRATEEVKAGLDKKAQLVTDATNKIEASQRAQTNELRELDNNPLLNATQRANRAADINRKYAFEQADYALIQSAANRDYTTAQSIVDRKIKLALEPLQTRLDYVKSFYEDNKATFDKAEDRQFKSLVTQADGEIKKAESNAKTITDFYSKAIESGQADIINSLSKLNPSSVNFVTDLGKVVSKITGNTIDKQIKQEQLKKLQAETKQIGLALPGPIQTKVQTIAGQFDSEQAVKNYQTIAESIDAVRNGGTSPVDDIQRIYAVAKVLDPSSAVKEGEYKTIESYAQSLLQRAGKKIQKVFDNEGFLTEEARKYINDTLDNRLASSEKAYKNIYEEYGRRINKLTGKNDGTEYITDYSRAFGQNPAQQMLSAPIPTTVKPYSPDVWNAFNITTP